MNEDKKIYNQANIFYWFNEDGYPEGITYKEEDCRCPFYNS